MCRYRYYFYGGCRHGEFVLVDFCENAQPIAPAMRESVAVATINAGKNNLGSDVGTGLAGGTAGLSDEEGASVGEKSDLTLLPSNFVPPSSSTHPPVDADSVSITAESDIDCSSFQSNQLLHSSSLPLTADPHNMAPFSRLGLPNWMTRSNVPSTQSNVNNPQQPSMNNTNNASIETVRCSVQYQ